MSSEDIQPADEEFTLACLSDEYLMEFIEWAVQALDFIPYNVGARLVIDVVLEEQQQRRMHQKGD